MTRSGQGKRRVRSAAAQTGARRGSVQMRAGAQRLGEPHHLVTRYRADDKDLRQFAVSSESVAGKPPRLAARACLCRSLRRNLHACGKNLDVRAIGCDRDAGASRYDS